MLVSQLLKPGGKFFFTAFDGKRVFKLLEDKKEWVSRSGDSIRYSIRKKYKSDTFQPHGQKIELLLPFSGGEYYEENLIDFDNVIGEFKRAGFMLVRKGGFSTFASDVKRRSNIYSRMTEDDIKFSSLYGYVILKKKKVSLEKEHKKIDASFDGD